MSTVSIIGAGSWGTAVATIVARAGAQPTLWAREQDVVQQIAEHGENQNFLPGIKLDSMITATTDLSEACKADIIVLAVPAQFIRSVATEMAKHASRDAYLMVASKGIEVDTGLFMSEILDEILPGRPVAILSGPSFADEVARGLPAAATLASESLTTSAWLARSFQSDSFQIETSDDVIGTQIGGALKNVLAIAVGIIYGRNMGFNTPMVVLTKGLAEMVQVAVAKGGRPETLMGFSGIGDICLTCTSETSRNRAFGVKIGQGVPASKLMAELDTVVEGAPTAIAVAKLAKKLGVQLPVMEAVDKIVRKGSDVAFVLEELHLQSAV
ncbi:MAG: NAD(P)H-dependent glycerol-3-phosphate dehydrogenase [Pseudomonadota bacterium]